MLESFWENLVWLIGGAHVEAEIPPWQLVFRTVVVYGVALFLIRVAKRRFMGGFTTFDIRIGPDRASLDNRRDHLPV
jgi:hypothetical protein